MIAIIIAVLVIAYHLDKCYGGKNGTCEL